MERGILGNAIRAARMEMGITQEKLAELVDIAPTHLKHIEGEHRKPSIGVLFNLAQVLQLSLDNLLFPTNEYNSEYHYAELLLKSCNEKELKLVIDLIKAIQNNRD